MLTPLASRMLLLAMLIAFLPAGATARTAPDYNISRELFFIAIAGDAVRQFFAAAGLLDFERDGEILLPEAEVTLVDPEMGRSRAVGELCISGVNELRFFSESPTRFIPTEGRTQILIERLSQDATPTNPYMVFTGRRLTFLYFSFAPTDLHFTWRGKVHLESLCDEI